MRNQNGITLIKLCIFIIIFVIIFVIGIITLKESYEISNIQKFVMEIGLIQEKVSQVRKEYTLWEKYDSNEPGNFYDYLQELGFKNAKGSTNIYIEDFNKIIDELSNNETKYWDSNTDSIIANYCYFTPQDLENKLGLKGINLHVIVNFYTGNIISKDGIKDKLNSDKIIYRQYDTEVGKPLVSTSINRSHIVPKIEVIENNGLSQNIKISFTSEDNKIEKIPDILEVYYYNNENDETRDKCSMLKEYIYKSSERAVYFKLEKSGEYSFIIEDKNHIQYPKLDLKINLCNPPILLNEMKGIYWDEAGNEIEISKYNDVNWYNYSKDEFKMANAKTSDGNYWVWVPRFIYKQTKESAFVEFVYGNSKNSTRNKSVTGYKLQEAFENDEDLKGFWISKFQVNEIYNENILANPGKTLIVLSKKNAIQSLKNNKLNAELMNNNERKAVMILAQANKVNIENNLVYYAGGGIKKEDYISNIKYSSTGNIYGVYDLVTSENELTKESSTNDFGRFRLVIKK